MSCKLFIANGCYIVLGYPDVIHTDGFLNEGLHVTNTSKLLVNKQHGLQNCHQYTKIIRIYKARCQIHKLWININISNQLRTDSRICDHMKVHFTDYINVVTHGSRSSSLWVSELYLTFIWMVQDHDPPMCLPYLALCGDWAGRKTNNTSMWATIALLWAVSDTHTEVLCQ